MQDRLDVMDLLWTSGQVEGWRVPRGRSVERFVAAPRAADVRQLLPWRWTTIAATASRVNDDRSMLKRARDATGAAALLAVGVLSPSRRLAVTSSDSLVQHVTARLDLGSTTGLVLCGPPRANQKPVVQIVDDRGRSRAFVKIAWNDLTCRLLENERDTLERLARCEHDGFEAPTVLDAGTFGAATWLALAPVGVERRSRSDQNAVDDLATSIERTGTAWTGPSATSEFVRRLMDIAKDLPVGQEAVESVVRRWRDAPLALAGSHGDFVPWNMLNGTPRPAVWDWERYRPAAPIGFDRLHHRVQVGLHRRRESFPHTLRRVGSALGAAIPEIGAGDRDAHFDWYLADLLCRYERDGLDHPSPLLSELVRQLALVLKERIDSP